MTKLPRRRRLENKTDYKARFGLLKSGKPRLVIRKTNRYIILQVVESDIAKDKVIVSANSSELLSKGWPKDKAGSLKSLPAAYLTGFLLGKKLAKHKKLELILDAGMNRTVHSSRIFAALKGAIDAGLQIPHNAEALPSKERLEQNARISNLINIVREKI